MAYEYPKERPNTNFDQLLKEFKHEVDRVSGGMLEVNGADLAKCLAFYNIMQMRELEALKKEERSHS